MTGRPQGDPPTDSLTTLGDRFQQGLVSDPSPAQIAGSASTRTARLYNKLPGEIFLDETERIHN